MAARRAHVHLPNPRTPETEDHAENAAATRFRRHHRRGLRSRRAEEDDSDPVVYGTRAPLRSFNPLWANLQVYRDLWLDSWRARSWADKLRVWTKPPGWRPADVAARWPRPAFDIASAQRFDPPLSARAAGLAVGLFVAALTGLGLFLWNVHRLSLGEQLLGSAALVVLLWAIGALTQQPSNRPPAAESAALMQ